MPAPATNLILTPKTAAIRVELEPAVNAVHSMVLIAKVDKLSGLDEWVLHTAEALSPKRFHDHRLTFEGFYFATIPDRSYPSFPAYLEALASSEPQALRDKVLNTYSAIPLQEGFDDPLAELGWEAILQDPQAYLTFIQSRFPLDHIDLNLEMEAYKLLSDPPAMKALIVAHMGHMWDEFMAAEWVRVSPMLQESVAAFRKVDFRPMSPSEVVRFITGNEMEEMEQCLLDAEQVIFVPSAHVGPYAGKFKSDGIAWLVFGARLPEGVPIVSPDLSRADLLVRLSALADVTRLRILALIKEHDGMCAQEVIDALGLSQSTASRHLRQLSASGYLVERRTEAGKCYRLNPDHLQGTLRALEDFLS